MLPNTCGFFHANVKILRGNMFSVCPSTSSVCLSSYLACLSSYLAWLSSYLACLSSYLAWLSSSLACLSSSLACLNSSLAWLNTHSATPRKNFPTITIYRNTIIFNELTANPSALACFNYSIGSFRCSCQ